MQWKEDTTAGSRMSTGRSAYGIRTTILSLWQIKYVCIVYVVTAMT